MAKASDIEGLIKREKDRHARKASNLNEQASAAQEITFDGLQKVTLARIKGERDDEAIRHKQKLIDLDKRLRKIWKKQ